MLQLFQDRIPRIFNCFLLCLWLLTVNVFGQDGIWNSASSGSWDDSLNWVGGTIANGTNSTAAFSSPILSLATVNLGSSRIIGNLWFSVAGANGPAWEIRGRSLTLSRSSGMPYVETSTSATIHVAISGVNGLEKRGAQTLTLTGKNTYSGGTSITNGTLAVDSLSSLGSGFLSLGNGTFRYLGSGEEKTSREVRLNSGPATFDIANIEGYLGLNPMTGVRNSDLIKTGAGTLEIGGGISGGAQILVDQGRLVLTAANTHSGGNQITAATLEVRNLAGLGTGSLSIFKEGVLDYRGIGSENSTQPLNLGSSTINVEAASAFLTFNPSSGTRDKDFTKTGAGTLRMDGDFSGAAAVQVDGGRLILTAANSYKGETRVSSGKLIVNNTSGSGTGTGSIFIAAGGTIGGNGRFSGALLADGIVAPGNSIGILTAGATTFNAGSSYDLEMDTVSPNGDLLNVDGDLTILDGAQLVFSELANGVVTLGTKLTLISYSGSWNGIAFEGHSQGSVFPIGSNYWQISYDDTTAGVNGGLYGNSITIVAVPESTSLFLVGVMLMVPGLTRRRK